MARWREAAVADAETQRPLSATERRELQQERKKSHMLEKELGRKEKALQEENTLADHRKAAAAGRSMPTS